MRAIAVLEIKQPRDKVVAARGGHNAKTVDARLQARGARTVAHCTWVKIIGGAAAH